MNWKLKALVQNAIARLPEFAAQPTYTWFQRHFGRLGDMTVMRWFGAAAETCRRLELQGASPEEAVFLEIGTGRAPVIPLAYWLMGAERTFSFDLNRYLDPLVFERSLQFVSREHEEIRRVLAPWLVDARLDRLLAELKRRPFETDRFLEMCNIDYRAPADAASTGLPAGSVDFHTSRTVLEHVPPAALLRILEEAGRVLRPDGLLVHRVDYSDHFAHTDARISAVNFLQYSDAAWARLADNRFMYMNRLRHDDLLVLFRDAGQDVLDEAPTRDERVRALIESGEILVDERFRAKPMAVLAVTGAWITSRCTAVRTPDAIR